MQLRPTRGGFLRPFGCGFFIREFLLGRGPEGSPKIDPDKGACQEDIFYHYKLALHRAYAEDAVAWENEERIRRGKPITLRRNMRRGLTGTSGASPISCTRPATTASSDISIG